MTSIAVAAARIRVGGLSQGYGNVLFLKQSYLTRAHPKPTATYHIYDAVQQVLDDAAERRTMRLEKWNRNLDQIKTKWEATNPPDKPFDPIYRNVDETFELVLGLNLDPRRANQVLRGSMSLRHGTGGPRPRIAVFTSQAQNSQACLDAGAMYAGGSELIQKFSDDSKVINVATDIDVCLASSDMLSQLNSLGRLLGPRGLMPNPKLGTLVTSPSELPALVERRLAGVLEYRVDKFGSLHAAPLGKMSFGLHKILDHVQAVMMEVVERKPEGAPKGKYLLRAFVSSQQGKSYKVDLPTIDPASVYFMIPPASFDMAA